MKGISFTKRRGISFRLYEHDNEKQDVLVPGVTIKTINGVSLMGKGNLNLATGLGGPGMLAFSVDPDNMHLMCENGVEGTFGLTENGHFIYQ